MTRRWENNEKNDSGKFAILSHWVHQIVEEEENTYVQKPHN